MHWLRRILSSLCAIAGVVLLIIGGASAPASAYPYRPAEPPDPSYPFTQVLDLLTKAIIRDATEPGMLDYFVKAGIMTNVGHLTEPFEALTKPETYSEPDANDRQRWAAQRIWDALTHFAPFGVSFPPHPDYLPDWNHNGKFGIEDTAGQLLINGDSDAMVEDNYDDPQFGEAQFRYPCLQPNGDVLYETADGTCLPGDSGAVFKLGTVKKSAPAQTCA